MIVGTSIGPYRVASVKLDGTPATVSERCDGEVVSHHPVRFKGLAGNWCDACRTPWPCGSVEFMRECWRKDQDEMCLGAHIDREADDDYAPRPHTE